MTQRPWTSSPCYFSTTDNDVIDTPIRPAQRHFSELASETKFIALLRTFRQTSFWCTDITMCVSFRTDRVHVETKTQETCSENPALIKTHGHFLCSKPVHRSMLLTLSWWASDATRSPRRESSSSGPALAAPTICCCAAHAHQLY